VKCFDFTLIQDSIMLILFAQIYNISIILFRMRVKSTQSQIVRLQNCNKFTVLVIHNTCVCFKLKERNNFNIHQESKENLPHVAMHVLNRSVHP
jgi:hypothetical protein